MSLSSYERQRRRQSCAACALERPKGARWKWCHACSSGPRPFCPSCWPNHGHAHIRALIVDIEASHVAELRQALNRLVAYRPDSPADLEIVRRVLEPDLILPPGFDRLGDTKKG